MSERAPYRAAIQAAAEARGLDPQLVEAIVWQESGGKADAFRYEPGYYRRYLDGREAWAGWEPRRIASSYGLMQVIYPTALETGWQGEPEALFQIPVNLAVGCDVLRELLAYFHGDVPVALAAYNGGRGGVTKARPQAYAREVLAKLTRVRGTVQA